MPAFRSPEQKPPPQRPVKLSGVSMAECPFCKNPVEEDLLRFGGHCPRCFIEIPGEETPTDPGQQSEPSAEGGATSGSSRRPVVFGGVAVLGVLAALAIWQFAVPGEAPETEAAVADGYDFYLAPAEHVDSAHKKPESESSSSGGTRGSSSSSSSGGSHAADSSSESSNSGQRKRAILDLRGEADTIMGNAGFNDEVAQRKPTIHVGSAIDVGTTGISISRRGADSYALSDPSEIREAVGHGLKRYGSQVTVCYENRLKERTDLEGLWEVHFTIEKDGSTSSIQVKRTSTRDDDLESCIKRRVEDWRFPPMAQPQTIQKPYRLGKG